MASSAVVDLVKHEPQAIAQSVFMPVMSMEVALERRSQIVEFTKRLMVPEQDFGVIPGTNKPSLLKPGAEKLCSFFGLEPEFTPLREDADWTGERHNGEVFYYVGYRCRLMRDGRVLGAGEGSCNSWESKYRYREGKRKCPSCGAEAIIKGKEEYGGGFICFGKKGGCGAKFKDNDPAIIDQQVGRVPNPDIADVVNTIQKMAQKRALVAATLIATSASEFFTQDTEDHQQGDPRGSQEAADEVRDRRIKELGGVPPVPDDEHLKAYLKRAAKNAKDRDEVYGELCEKLVCLTSKDSAELSWDAAISGAANRDTIIRRMYEAIKEAESKAPAA